MIEKTFTFLPGIGSKKEKSIYKQGIRNWNSFLETKKEKAKKELYGEKLSYFLKNLPKKENYKLYELFKDELVFLDIEVDSKRNIIVVGLFDGFESKFLVKNVNLYREILKKELEKYKLVVTFNGSSFDLPLIEKQFDLPLTLLHID